MLYQPGDPTRIAGFFFVHIPFGKSNVLIVFIVPLRQVDLFRSSQSYLFPPPQQVAIKAG